MQSMERNIALQHVIDLLLSPLEEPFQRYLDICDDVHACDASGNTLLHWAAALGNFSAAYALLQRGVAVDARNRHGATALLVAAAVCPNVATLGFLLVSRGASLDAGLGDNEDVGVNVQSLLESRHAGQVWSWLLDCHCGISQGEDSRLSSFHGCRELPATKDGTAYLLCSPKALAQLRGRPGDAAVTGAGVSVATTSVLSVPRPPRRDAAASSTSSRATAAAQSGTPTRSASRHAAASASDPRPLQVALLVSHESTGRVQIEKEQVESFLELYAATTALLDGWYEAETAVDDVEEEDSGWESPKQDLLGGRGGSNGSGGAAGLVGCIECVLGERTDADGRHHLLVQYSDPSGVSGHGETWQWADAVMSDPVVRAHLARSYSGNVSVDTSEAKTLSIMTMHNVGSPLDTWEREQLEAQLRLLPRRVLQSGDGGGVSRGSPLYPYPLTTSPSSPTNTFGRHGATPIMANFVFSEQALLGRSDRHHATNQHGPSAAGHDAPSSSDDTQLRASWRFAAGNPRHSGAPPEEEHGARSAGVSPTVRQLQLSDRWVTQSQDAEVLVDDAAGSSINTAAPPRQTPTPFSAKHTAASDYSSDTLGSFSPVQSTAPTKEPTTYSSGNARSAREPDTHLTATQKIDYDAFLYGSALRLLDQQHRRRRRTDAAREQSS